jgi:hypothetical protein
MSMAGGRINYKECRGLDICEHGRQKDRILGVQSSSICEHGRQKSASRSAEEETM